MKVHQALAKAVDELGATAVFGLLGDANLFFGESLVNETEVEYVPVAHEASAVLGAAGYATTSGRVGIATVTHGPAFSNTLTPLIEAARNSTPLVLIAGDTELEDEGNLQDIPQEALVAPTGAGFIQVRTPEQATRALATAFRQARFERRPVVLNIPRPLQLADVEYEAVHPERSLPASTPTEEDLDGAAGMLTWARRPVILAGHGAIGPDSRAAMVELATFLGAPLATTLKAKGLFKGEPLDIGVFGTLSTEKGVELIADADCVAAFGASLSRFTTDAGALLEGKRVIQCNVDGSALGATVDVDEQLIGDAASTARSLVALLTAAGSKPSGWYRGAPDGNGKVGRSTHPDRRPGTVDLQETLDWMEENLPDQRHLAVDVGRFMLATLKTLSVPEPRSYVHAAGIGAIGLSVPTAIGAWKGSPDRPIVTVAGDGGFMLGGLTEFNTAVRSNVDLILFVMNDGAYGAEHIQFSRRDLDPSVVEMDWPDFAEVADSLGGRGLTVREPADLAAVKEAIDNRDRPLLIDVKLDPAAIVLEGH
jgi:thiamine pyrophosphate-dependent acetolactate synthase large subunit-like protein